MTTFTTSNYVSVSLYAVLKSERDVSDLNTTSGIHFYCKQIYSNVTELTVIDHGSRTFTNHALILTCYTIKPGVKSRKGVPIVLWLKL